MVFIEHPEFIKDAATLFSDDDLFALQCWLAQHPDDGDVIQGTGGCRKIRWAAKQKGKRGGARVIYFHRISASQIELQNAYAKNEKENLSPSEITALKKRIK
jgi:hypothetical protein